MPYPRLRDLPFARAIIAHKKWPGGIAASGPMLYCRSSSACILRMCLSCMKIRHTATPATA